jgi:hypothetical protein
MLSRAKYERLEVSECNWAPVDFFVAGGSFERCVSKFSAPARRPQPFYFNTKSAFFTLPASAFSIRDTFRFPIMTVSL